MIPRHEMSFSGSEACNSFACENSYYIRPLNIDRYLIKIYIHSDACLLDVIAHNKGEVECDIFQV